jgi:hypothetical protein
MNKIIQIGKPVLNFGGLSSANYTAAANMGFAAIGAGH